MPRTSRSRHTRWADLRSARTYPKRENVTGEKKPGSCRHPGHRALRGGRAVRRAFVQDAKVQDAKVRDAKGLNAGSE